jgi:hypothetical protein
MFDKQRESLEASKNYQKVKTHVQTNKRTYITGAGCFVAGGVIFSKRPELKQTVDAFKFQWKSPTTNVVSQELTRRGHPGFKTRNNVTGETAASIARMDAVSRTFVKNHMVGTDPIYTNLGEMC